MEKNEIIIYQNDFRNRTKADDENPALFEEEAGQMLNLLREPQREEIKDLQKAFYLVLFIKNIAADLRGRCACTLSADCSEMKIEIIAKEFSLQAHHRLALGAMCKDLIGMQIRFVDGEIVMTARYPNEPFSIDEELLRLLRS